MKFTEYLTEETNNEKLEEGVSNDAKTFIKKMNEIIKFLKEDVKESDTSDNWKGRVEQLGALCSFVK